MVNRHRAGPRPDSTIRTTAPKPRSGDELDPARLRVMSALRRLRAARQHLEMFKRIAVLHGIGAEARDGFEDRLDRLRAEVEKAEADVVRAQRSARSTIH